MTIGQEYGHKITSFFFVIHFACCIIWAELYYGHLVVFAWYFMSACKYLFLPYDDIFYAFNCFNYLYILLDIGCTLLYVAISVTLYMDGIMTFI